MDQISLILTLNVKNAEAAALQEEEDVTVPAGTSSGSGREDAAPPRPCDPDFKTKARTVLRIKTSFCCLSHVH